MELYASFALEFNFSRFIGYGSSAVVYNATYKPKNVRVAIKMIDLDLFERNQIDELRVNLQQRKRMFHAAS
jgi:serine/threonine protein kinase